MPTLVPSSGPRDAKIAFVGEAPGAQEVSSGAPFTGQSGRLLTELMQMASIVRASCYLTNVVKERPLNNDITQFIDLQHNRISDEYKLYESQLHNELAEIDANVIVPLGSVPLYALTRLRGITKWRGSILESVPSIGRRKIIPTIHPAGALRTYIWRYWIVSDLRRALEESTTSEIRLPARQLRINPTSREALNYIGQLRTAREPIGFDIEVINEELSCFALSRSPMDAMCIPVISYSEREEIAVVKALGNLLECQQVTKIGQNIIFDCSFMLRKYGIRTRNVEDTMVAQGIAYPEFPKGLDFITVSYTREPYYKDEGKKWSTTGVSDTAFWIYNAKDAAVCQEALPQIKSDLEERKSLPAYDRQINLIEPLMYMQERGVRMDYAGLMKASSEASTKIEQFTEDLCTIAQQTLNPNSPKQLKEYFYGMKGIKPYVNRKTGQPTVDEDALKRIARKGFTEASVILEIRHLSKLKGTYLDVKLDNDGRLRCAFNPVGTSSGRLSSSKTIFGTGTNMQNLPKEFKRYMLADDGYVLYNMDLAQAENRVVAYVSPEPNMVEAFETGVDIHRQTAALILGKPIDEITQEERDSTGKRANHGLNYDLGYKTFAFLYEIGEKEARHIVEKYHQVYPGVRKGHKWVRGALGRDRTLSNCFGRRRLFLDRWGDPIFKEAYSYNPQSTVAEITNQWGIIYAYHNLQEVELLSQVHDSIGFQISRKSPWNVHAAAIQAIRGSLQQPIKWRGMMFSIPAECETGMNFRDMTEIDMDGDIAKQLEVIHGAS